MFNDACEIISKCTSLSSATPRRHIVIGSLWLL
jgi:hypothetical protein